MIGTIVDSKYRSKNLYILRKCYLKWMKKEWHEYYITIRTNQMVTDKEYTDCIK